MRFTTIFGFRLPERLRGIRDDRADIEDINFNMVEIDSILNVQSDRITTESNARTTADNALGARIDAEAQTRANSVNSLSERINDESLAREGAVASLSSEIEKERLDRDNAITSESNARENADNALGSTIDAHVGIRGISQHALAGGTDASAGFSQANFMQTEKTKLGGVADNANNFGENQVRATSATGLVNNDTAAPAAEANIIQNLSRLWNLIRTHIGSRGAAHTNAVASGDAGFMTGADKGKLDGIANNANNYTHPSHTARNDGLSGATVPSRITVDNQGHVTDLETRNLTAGNIGAATATQGDNADNAVRFNAAQTLNATQQSRARQNVGITDDRMSQWDSGGSGGFSEAQVRATPMTGLVTTDTAPPAAANTLIQALSRIVSRLLHRGIPNTGAETTLLGYIVAQMPVGTNQNSTIRFYAGATAMNRFSDRPPLSGRCLIIATRANAEHGIVEVQRVNTDTHERFVRRIQAWNSTPNITWSGEWVQIPTQLATQAEMETGTSTNVRSMNPLRVAQAVRAISRRYEAW